MAAFVRGEPADIDQAIQRAADLLGASRFPVIAGLGTDVAGAKAAVRLARRLRGALDHMASEALLTQVRLLQDFGTMATTPAEAARRADLLVLVGPGAGRRGKIPSALVEALAEGTREAVWLCPGSAATPERATRIGGGAEDLAAVLGLVHAAVKRRPVRASAWLDRAALDAVAGRLRAARFGVVLYDPAELDPLMAEAVHALVKDLNRATRFSTLAHALEAGAEAVNEVAAWSAGVPLRMSFGRGVAEHDPWRYSAERLVESGEADAALWVAALPAASPGWHGRLPTVALVGAGDAAAQGAEVAIEVGQPGLDHDAVLLSAETGAMTYVAGAGQGNRPSAAAVLDGIEAGLSAA